MEENGSTREVGVIPTAMAEHFGCDPQELGIFLAIGEHPDAEGNIVISSVWSSVPHWYLLGMVDELKAHVERLRIAGELDAITREE
jgi:hypothetical protein